MSFVIDTGSTGDSVFTPESTIPDWFQDQLPADATVEKKMHDFAYHIIGAMQNPKTFEAVRKHICRDWSFLRQLALIHPEVFDEVLCAYGERWQELH